MIKVEMLEGEFKGSRTAYTSDSIFIAVLSNVNILSKLEIIGDFIFPDGFGCIQPPGPSFGFGLIELLPEEESGSVNIQKLISRVEKRDTSNDDEYTDKNIQTSLLNYFDGFFIYDKNSNTATQITSDKFVDKFLDGSYKTINFIEFEPD
jgi:hypothetical protein